MANGMFTAVAGSVAALQRLDMVAHDLANAQTTGFKSDDMSFTQVERDTRKSLEPAHSSPTDKVYPQADKTFVRREQGAMIRTGNALDIAMQGDVFLRIEGENGTRLSRDGRLSVRSDGQLQTTMGERVLDDSGRAIFLPSDAIPTISPDGRITVPGAPGGDSEGPREVARLGLMTVGRDIDLKKDRAGRFEIPEGAVQGLDTVATMAVVQGHLEDSNVDAVAAMTRIIEIQRHFQALQQVITTYGELDQRATSLIGG